MKYVVLGAAGHISKPLTEKLLQLGHSVTVVGRDASKLKELTAKGATAAIGSVEDTAFLTKTFAGADAVYTMVPPNFQAPDMKDFIGSTGEKYAAAILQSGVKYVVNLSSMGADLPEGCGPVSGLFRVEKALNKLEGVNIRHLRPVFFFQNFLSTIGLIKQAGIIGNNFSLKVLPLVDPHDIASAAAEELTGLNFKGSSVRYVASEEVSTDQVASSLGKAIGKPELPWIEFTDEQSLNGMIQAGLPENPSKNYVEMGQAMRSGNMIADYLKHRPSLGKVKLDDFAREFSAAFGAV